MSLTLYKVLTPYSLTINGHILPGQAGDIFSAESTDAVVVELLSAGALEVTSPSISSEMPLDKAVAELVRDNNGTRRRSAGGSTSFTGMNNAGPGSMPIAVQGALVGQQVTFTPRTRSGPRKDRSAATHFETKISVANQIQQTFVGDLSNKDYLITLS